MQTISYAFTNLPYIGQGLMIPDFLFKETFIKIAYKIRRMFRQNIEGNLGEKQIRSNPNGGINLRCR